MDTNAYISSGILELYANGLLNSQEQAEVEVLLAQHSELRTELKEIELSLEQYAMANAIAPRAVLKNKILTTITTDAVVYRINPMLRYAMAASIALVLLMGGIIVSLMNQIGEKESQIAQFEAIRNPKAVKITLAGVQNHPEADAVVYWDTDNKDVVIDCVDLPKADDTHQYQLWALVDGKPVDAGTFEDEAAMQQLKKVNKAQAFAVTLEPKGGSQNPTLEQMYLYTEL